MDLKTLASTVHWLDYSSFTLNSEYYIVLVNSLLVLQNDNHFKKIFFWGLIHGMETDYYIAFGYKTDAITDRKFFYSEDCQNWKLLPLPQREHLILTELCRKPFSGDPSLVLEIVDDAPAEELFPEKEPIKDKHDDNEVKKTEEGNLPESGKIEKDYEFNERKLEQNNKPIAGETVEGNKAAEENKIELEGQGIKYEDKNVEEERKQSQEQIEKKNTIKEIPPITSGELKEEDRIAAIVHIITDETALTPRGGLFKQSDGLLIHSKAFEGLQLEDADELSSFQHYRTPQQEWNVNLLNRTDYNYAIDFLDTIDKDLPSDCWTAQLVEGDRAITLRNLNWPGFMFFHYLTTPDHGFVYVGDGQRNLDLPFMTQVIMPIADSVTVKKPSVKVSTVSAVKTISKVNKTKPLEETEPVKEIEDEIITSA